MPDISFEKFHLQIFRKAVIIPVFTAYSSDVLNSKPFIT